MISSNPGPHRKAAKAGTSARSLLIAVAAVSLGLILLPKLLRRPSQPATPEVAAPGETPSPATSPSVAEPRNPEVAVTEPPPPDPTSGTDTGIAVISDVLVPPPAPPLASPEVLRLVDNLTNPTQFTDPLTAEQAGAWKQQWQQLVEQGAGGVSAIREFLKKNQDMAFTAGDAQAIGYPTARAAMFDALRKIGGPEGIAATLQTMQGTGDPREILALARNLEAMAPGEHRQEALQVAQAALAQAARGELNGYDVGPLFQVMQQVGGGNLVPDLEKASGQWNYYSAMALANLPEGAGVPALIQMAQSGTSRTIAFEMLAQLATQNTDARSALLEHVRANTIPPSLWPYLGSVLGGDQYQFVDAVWQAVQDGQAVDRMKSGSVRHGNQGFYQGPPIGGFTPDQIQQQTALIDDLLRANSNPRAVEVLEAARKSLTTRLVTSAPPPPP